MNTEGAGLPQLDGPRMLHTAAYTPRSLTAAAVVIAVTDDSDHADPISTDAGFTHGWLVD
jgi:hypothetical protein